MPSRSHFDEHILGPEVGPRHIRDLDHVGRTVPTIDGGFHERAIGGTFKRLLGGTRRIAPVRFPQLNGLAFGIVEAGKATMPITVSMGPPRRVGVVPNGSRLGCRRGRKGSHSILYARRHLQALVRQPHLEPSSGMG